MTVQTAIHNSRKVIMIAILGLLMVLSAPQVLQAKNESKTKLELLGLLASQVSTSETAPIVSGVSTKPIPLTPPTPPSVGQKNHAPMILTRKLPFAKIGQPYKASIQATDRDGDTMIIRVYNLPEGLYVNECTQFSIFKRSFMNCTVIGTPSTSYSDTVTAVVEDERGGVTKKIFKMNVN